MKYMTFNSSCSYAGIANMLEQYGFDTSDRTIALTMKLPYLFYYHDEVYLSGPMLQTAEWFNLYLNPIGYELLEKSICAEEVVDYLKLQKTAMLGIKIDNIGKHAVVYTGIESNQIVFLNNKWEHEESPSEIRLTEDELKKRLESHVVVATLQQIIPQKVNLTDKLRTSIDVLQANLLEIIEICNKEETIESLRSKLNTIFRPLFLDGITMLNLVGEIELSQVFSSLQRELLGSLRQESHQRIFLKKYISVDKLQASVTKYVEMIGKALETTENE